jgi:hypothetical protein
MSNECDKCGIEYDFCRCHVKEFEERISFLEDEMEKLTNVVDKMNNFIKLGTRSK